MIRKPVNKLHKTFFQIQLVVSIILMILVSFYMIKKWKEEQEMSQMSEIVNKAFEVETVYAEKQSVTKKGKNNNKYFGKIVIPQIELEYSVFNECNDELLKILPCKFYGAEMDEKGNICIAGHNYNDTRFFSRLKELKKGENIYLTDLEGKNYQYRIYDKYKVEANNFECLKAKKTYDLTLITCDNTNGKRLVIRASRL